MKQLIELIGNVTAFGSLTLEGDVEVAKGGSGYPYYDGDYIVTPKSYKQILDTDYKILTDDVTVEKIPYNEAPNLQGGLTISIGG